jgi:hypothetical protein
MITKVLLLPVCVLEECEEITLFLPLLSRDFIFSTIYDSIVESIYTF